MVDVTSKNVFIGMSVTPGRHWNNNNKGMWKYDKNTKGTVTSLVNKNMIFKSYDNDLNNTTCEDKSSKDWCVVSWDTNNGNKEKGIYSIGATYPIGKWWTKSSRKIGEGGGYGEPCYNLYTYRTRRSNSLQKLLSEEMF